MLFIGRKLPNAGVNVICVGSVFHTCAAALGRYGVTANAILPSGATRNCQ
jgi:hypothetical protein